MIPKTTTSRPNSQIWNIPYILISVFIGISSIAIVYGVNYTLSQSETTEAEELKPILACREHEHPTLDLDKDGEPESRFSSLIFETVAEDAGYRVIWHELDWNECLTLVETGTLNVLIDGHKRPDRFLTLEPYWYIRVKHLYVMEDYPVKKFIDWSQFHNKTIGFPDGYKISHFHELIKQERYKSEEALLLALSKGEIDGIIVINFGFLERAKELGYKVRALRTGVGAYGNLWHKGSYEMAETFSEAMRAFKDGGELDYMYYHYKGWDRKELLGIAKDEKDTFVGERGY